MYKVRSAKTRYKVLICGAFAFESMATGGQPVKSRELYYGLVEMLGKEAVAYLDTVGWKKNPIKLLHAFFSLSGKSEIVIMLPAQRGLLVFTQLLFISKKLFGNKIYYDVIGGWLYESIKNSGWLVFLLQQFDGIWVETPTMKDKLRSLQLMNVDVLYNFKSNQPIDKKNITFPDLSNKVFRTCTFSRVTKTKGIEDAVKAVQLLSTDAKTKIILDIYGPIDPAYENEFRKIIDNTPENIRYCGEVNPEGSVDLLKRYDLLLFPTFYPGEGMPGTIIDAYFSGLPVIASKWHYNEDIVIDGVTGYLINTHDYTNMSRKIYNIMSSTDKLYEMRLNCLNEAEKYTKRAAMKKISQLLGIT